MQLEEVTNNGKSYRLLKLRNPWGKSEWDGQWSDNSEIWTEELLTRLKVDTQDDGVFWISVDDYIRFYNGANIAYLQFGSKNYSHIINDPEVLEHPLVYKLSLQ